MMNRLRRRWWLVLLAFLALGALTIVAWVAMAPTTMPEALAALESDAQITVETEKWLVFRPLGRAPRVGLVVYPGGLIDPSAYAPTAKAIASEGYLVAIVPMPLKLAVLGADRARGVLEAFPEVAYWAIGGHSLGGAMAAQFARKHPDLVQGLVLWGAYPSGSDDLSTSNVQVVSLYATRDGLTSLQDIERSRPLLPSDAQFVAIEGGNHSQFGWYGPQRGDNQATISRNVQQAQIVEATLDLLRRLEDGLGGSQSRRQ